jgi:type I restriction enzyme S subunit
MRIKNENKPGYKISKVGWIPDGWECQPLCKLGIQVIDGDRGTNYPSQSEFFPAGYCLFLNAGNVTSTGFRFAEKQFISKERDALLRKGKLQRGDLVVTTRGTIGNFAHYTNSIQYDHIRINSGMAILRSDNNKVNTAFIAHYFLSAIFEKELRRVTFGSAIPQLTIGLIQKIHLPVSPSLPEQKAIAGVMECWDKGIRNLELKIKKKRLIKKGLMQRLLSGKKRLKGFTDAWKTVSLGDCLDKMNNGFVYKPVDSGSISVTRIETISSGKIDYSRIGYADPSPEITKFKMIKGDILYSHINSIEHIGKVALYQEEAELYHGMNLLLLRVSKCSSEFFIYYILTSDLCRKSAQQLAKKAVSQASINTVELKKMLIPLPPLAEQQAIADVLTSADSEIESLEKKLALWKEQKKYLLNNLVTGTIRLPQFCVKA